MITDRRGLSYRVEKRGSIYYALDEQRPVARAVFAGQSVSDVLVYSATDRRHGIASALYRWIELDAGVTLRPSRIKTAAGKQFWKARQ